MNKQIERMIEGAKHYAAYDKSDPFSLARSLLHIKRGVAGINQDGGDAFYSADPY